MLTLRPANQRGHANHVWLDSHFSFSFAEYYDPRHMGFRALRVINEDTVAPQMGFGMHPHRDMEILSYVLAGAVQHKDSMGSSEILRPGELQRMSAGDGVRHSETNPSATEPFHMLQIWLMPNRLGVAPRYEQRPFPIQSQPNQLHLLASPHSDPAGSDGSFHVYADADLLAAKLTEGGTVTHTFRNAYGYLQVARGTVQVGDQTLRAGDALQLEAEPTLTVSSDTGAEFLLFDLA